MPKIIENLREQLLAEAKKQTSEQGYAKTTIRSVAGACGVGIGTVYNYFESKDVLIASFMVEDWQRGIGVPYASTWINQRKWTDEARAPIPAQRQEVSYGWR